MGARFDSSAPGYLFCSRKDDGVTALTSEAAACHGADVRLFQRPAPFLEQAWRRLDELLRGQRGPTCIRAALRLGLPFPTSLTARRPLCTRDMRVGWFPRTPWAAACSSGSCRGRAAGRVP